MWMDYAQIGSRMKWYKFKPAAGINSHTIGDIRVVSLKWLEPRLLHISNAESPSHKRPGFLVAIDRLNNYVVHNGVILHHLRLRNFHIFTRDLKRYLYLVNIVPRSDLWFTTSAPTSLSISYELMADAIRMLEIL